MEKFNYLIEVVAGLTVQQDQTVDVLDKAHGAVQELAEVNERHNHNIQLLDGRTIDIATAITALQSGRHTVDGEIARLKQSNSQLLVEVEQLKAFITEHGAKLVAGGEGENA